MNVQVTRERRNRSPLWNGPGLEWKWIYHLPAREVKMPDGRIAQDRPGGVSTKAEIVQIAKRVYDERPLTLNFPDGTVKEVKR